MHVAVVIICLVVKVSIALILEAGRSVGIKITSSAFSRVQISNFSPVAMVLIQQVFRGYIPEINVLIVLSEGNASVKTIKVFVLVVDSFYTIFL